MKLVLSTILKMASIRIILPQFDEINDITTLATGSWHFVQHNQTDEHDRIHHQQMLHVWGVFPKNRHESQ